MIGWNDFSERGQRRHLNYNFRTGSKRQDRIVAEEGQIIIRKNWGYEGIIKIKCTWKSIESPQLKEHQGEGNLVF